MHIVWWSPCQQPLLLNIRLVRQNNTYIQHFILMFSIPVCLLFQNAQLKCKSSHKFHFLMKFICYGSYIGVFGDLPTPCPLNYQYNVMLCIETTQIAHGNLYICGRPVRVRNFGKPIYISPVLINTQVLDSVHVTSHVALTYSWTLSPLCRNTNIYFVVYFDSAWETERLFLVHIAQPSDQIT